MTKSLDKLDQRAARRTKLVGGWTGGTRAQSRDLSGPVAASTACCSQPARSDSRTAASKTARLALGLRPAWMLALVACHNCDSSALSALSGNRLSASATPCMAAPTATEWPAP